MLHVIGFRTVKITRGIMLQGCRDTEDLGCKGFVSAPGCDQAVIRPGDIGNPADLDLAGVTRSLDRLAGGGVTGRIVLKGATP